MRRKYTIEERRVWNKRYSKKMRKAGWVYCSFLVPKDVGDTLKKLKLELMTGYKAGLALKVEMRDKNEGGNKLTFYAFNQMDK